MAQEGKEELIGKFYSNFFESALRAVFLNNEQIGLRYLERPAAERKAIEDEINRKARALGRRLASKLARLGYLERDPPRDVLERIVRETLAEGA